MDVLFYTDQHNSWVAVWFYYNSSDVALQLFFLMILIIPLITILT